MGRRHSRMPGLRKQGTIWHIDKRVQGYGRLCESTGTSDRAEAERYLVHRLEELRQATVYGVRPRRTWREAALRYVESSGHLRSLADQAGYLRTLDGWIGTLPLDSVHDDTLRPWVEHEQCRGIRAKSINNALGVVRRVLNLAARSWRDPATGLTWLAQAPLVTMLPVQDSRQPYPLDWDEQDRLIRALPLHLQRMALYGLHTGCREQEVCGLRWEWVNLDQGVVVLPASATKANRERVVVLNRVARSVVGHCESAWVFTYEGRRVQKMHNTAWKRAWVAAGLPMGETLAGPHNLRHTFARRLRAAGVGLETRRALLGHKTGDLTTHYSAAELAELRTAVERVAERPREAGVMLRAVR